VASKQAVVLVAAKFKSVAAGHVFFVNRFLHLGISGVPFILDVQLKSVSNGKTQAQRPKGLNLCNYLWTTRMVKK
jgi:hypothetical protein